jgi:apolipoprotein D and lipocalin family protein
MLHKQARILEREIHACEANIRQHDLALSVDVQRLRQQARQAFSGKALAVGGAVLGGTAAAWWWSREHRHAGAGHERRHHERRDATDARPRRGRDWPGLAQRWLPLLLPLASPLLSRKVASTLAGLGLPVMVRPLRPLPTVLQLDLARYAGLWYEVARLPLKAEAKCARNVTATYVLDGDGYLVVNRCVDDDGKPQEATGRARLPDVDRPGQLEVSFAPPALRWWPGTWGDYWVLFVDDDYQVALVGTPDRDQLWVLGRSPSMAREDLEALKSLALRHGFDVGRLIETPHDAVKDVKG